MLIEKYKPEGVDAVINKLQRDLFIELTKNFSWTKYDSYHRAYRNQKDKDSLPEVYTSNGDYKEVLFNDKETVTSFFLVDEKRAFDPKNNVWSQGISIIFQAKLNNLFPEIKHRADEELIDNVRLAIKKRFWENRLEEIVTGIDKVYDSLKVNYDKKYFDDMGDYSVARFNFKMLYTNTDIVTPIQ